MNASRFATVLLIAVLMTACHQQRVFKGDLDISVLGIPDPQNARIAVLQPDDTTRTLTVRGGQSQRLENLPVGSYTITPSAIVGFKTPEARAVTITHQTTTTVELRFTPESTP